MALECLVHVRAQVKWFDGSGGEGSRRFQRVFLTDMRSSYCPAVSPGAVARAADETRTASPESDEQKDEAAECTPFAAFDTEAVALPP
jgi:hypothetical protein